MHNSTMFAEDVRVGVDNLLDAMASTGITRKMHLRVVGRYVMRAAADAHTPEEKDLVDRIGAQLADMRERPNG